jgi:hypothetical protein
MKQFKFKFAWDANRFELSARCAGCAVHRLDDLVVKISGSAVELMLARTLAARYDHAEL